MLVTEVNRHNAVMKSMLEGKVERQRAKGQQWYGLMDSIWKNELGSV